MLTSYYLRIDSTIHQGSIISHLHSHESFPSKCSKRLEPWPPSKVQSQTEGKLPCHHRLSILSFLVYSVLLWLLSSLSLKAFIWHLIHHIAFHSLCFFLFGCILRSSHIWYIPADWHNLARCRGNLLTPGSGTVSRMPCPGTPESLVWRVIRARLWNGLM